MSGPSTPNDTTTVRLRVPQDAYTSERLYRACCIADTCHNLAVQWLVPLPQPPQTPPRNARELDWRWTRWRDERAWMHGVPQALWRGALANAYEQVARWHEDKVFEPTELLYRRARRDRNRENACTIAEGVRREGEHALYLPGIGTVRVRESLPEDFTPLGATVVERTSEARARSLGQYLRDDQRTFEVHVQVRDARSAHLQSR